MLERKNGFILEERMGLNLKDGFRQTAVGEFSLTGLDKYIQLVIIKAWRSQ